MKLFLISARYGCGKDTVSVLIEDILFEYKIDVYDFKFAKGVKNCAYSMGWDGKKDDCGRHLLQFIGKTGRKYDQDFWVKQVDSEIWQGIYDSAVVITISDWRFENEFLFLHQTKKYDIIKVRVESPEREQRDSPNYNDESEISLPSGQEFPEYYDYVIWNTGSLDDLKNKVKYMLIDLELIKE